MVAARAQLPTGPGVYRFRDERGRALYLGRAVNLRRRVASYWGDLRDRPRLRSMVRRIASIEAVLCESEHEAAWLERNVLSTRSRPWNRMLGGLETPVFIRLTARPARRSEGGVPAGKRAHLRAVSERHQDTRRRRGPAPRLPARLHRSGVEPSERDMAVKLRVSQDDRLSIVDALTGSAGPPTTRGRRSTPPHDRPARRRRGGCSRFERAGRIQDELAALDWITSPQRVTVQDVYDWCSMAGRGLLVAFRGVVGPAGRVASAAVHAGPREAKLAATPPQWRAFRPGQRRDRGRSSGLTAHAE
jgi:excinuclease ABC subunit C